MKKIIMTIVSMITMVNVIGSVTVNTQAEATFRGFTVADVVSDAKAVMADEFSSVSIPLRIQNDIMRIDINKSCINGKMTFEVGDLILGGFDPNPKPLTEQQIRDTLGL